MHFWASWADQCAQMDEVLKALVEIHQGKVVFGRCEAEEVSDLAQRFNISAVPTVLLVKGMICECKLMTFLISGGKEVSRINGIDPVKLSEQVEKLAAGAELSDEKVVAETLNEKLHRLIHQDAIVLFMKGTPAEPFCKFRSVFRHFAFEVQKQF